MMPPKVSPLDFFMGHRFCTYRENGEAALHTDSEVGAMKSSEPWAWDNKRHKWIKKPPTPGTPKQQAAD